MKKLVSVLVALGLAVGFTAPTFSFFRRALNNPRSLAA